MSVKNAVVGVLVKKLFVLQEIPEYLFFDIDQLFTGK
jgi:hypothetical protein